MFPLGVNH